MFTKLWYNKIVNIRLRGEFVMDFFKKLKKTEGGYIFISHSHKDIEKVRKIRNQLEEDGFEPLCFYLKCLDDANEIEDLIKREIDAREWFLFVNSPNSQTSKWVTLERQYITKTNKKKILSINLEDEKSINATIQKIRNNLRVFISYSAKDEMLARKIKKRFEKKDYQVFFAPDSIPANSRYIDVITDAIVEASQTGCVVVLVTENSMGSSWVENEIAVALSQGGNILPIIVGDINFDLNNPIWYQLAHYNGVLLPSNPTIDMIDKRIDRIGQMIAY